MHLKRLLIAGTLGLTVAGAYGALYKWVDENGRVQYSDKPPTEKDKGGVQMSNRGIIMKKIEGGLTPEQKKAKEDEIARKKVEEVKAAEQRRQDNALLQSFSSVQEIDMKRDRELQALESMIVNLRGQERTVSERLLDERNRAESYTQRKKPLPDSIKDDVTRSENEKKVLNDEIARRQQEIVDTRSKYDVLRKRYIELRQESQTGAIQPATSTPPVTAKK
jgi:Domain of unknown function (DUF4124)